MAAAQPFDLMRLKEEQSEAVQATEEKILKLNGFQNDYKSLQLRLKTLPDKVKHDIMVPFGRLAFMPGQLIHTNEITVLLGDNWFVERSAKEASEILSRRIEALNQQTSDLRKQLKLLTPRLDYTSQLHEVQAKDDWFEIQEEFDEEKEELWRKRHKKNIRQHRSNLKEEEEAKQTDDSDIFERLHQLQMQERKNHEMANLASDEDFEARLSGTIEKMFKAEMAGDEEDKEEEEEETDSAQKEEEEEEEEETDSVPTIQFSHSRILPQSDMNTAANAKEIISPSDIYTKFSTLKSILKSPGDRRLSSVTFKDEVTDIEESEEVVAAPKIIQTNES